MRLKLRKMGEAAAVAVVDIGLEKISPTVMNLGRAAMFATGLVLNAATDKYAEDSETLYVAATPLVVRSLMNGLGAITDYRHKQFGWPGVSGGPTRNIAGWMPSGPTTSTPGRLNIFK